MKIWGNAFDREQYVCSIWEEINGLTIDSCMHVCVIKLYFVDVLELHILTILLTAMWMFLLWIRVDHSSTVDCMCSWGLVLAE